MKFEKYTLVLMSLLVMSAPAYAGEVVREFSGTSTMTTPPFNVNAPWIIDWRLNGDYDQLVALDITLVEARTGKHVGRVLHTKRKGNGVRMFMESGVYQLRISSTLARWRVKVEQLSDEEAEGYKPKRQKDSVFDIG